MPMQLPQLSEFVPSHPGFSSLWLLDRAERS